MSTSAPQESSPPRARKLARVLGWFSLALGAPQLASPGTVNRLIGVRDDRESRLWQRVVGVREVAAWAGLVTRPRPVGWTWARVAGDVKDLTLLGAAFRSKNEKPERLAATAAAVAGVTALDVYTAVRMSRARQAETKEEEAMEKKPA